MRDAREIIQLTYQANAQINRIDVDTIQSDTKWSTSPVGLFKVNWDVAISKQNQRMGVGVIIRDERGKVNAALSQTVCTVYDPTTAEIMAALTAVELCRDMGFFDILLEGDSLMAVKAIKLQQEINASYGHLLEDIQLVLTTLRSCDIKHIRREANEAVHILAREASKNHGNNIWVEETSVYFTHYFRAISFIFVEAWL